ncbi:hypothetical protein VTI74DRAFT_7164 [Chaetomium olivicolor]
MRRLSLLWPATCLMLIILTLYVHRVEFVQIRRPNIPQTHQKGSTQSSTSVAGPSPTATATQHEILPQATREAYVNAIMNPDVEDLPRLQCPKLDADRYKHLQVDPKNSSDSTIQYFFALDLRQCLPLLPRLIGSVVEAIRFLGPAHCALSIVEGNSDDGTGEVLAALQPVLSSLGTTYYFRRSSIDPKKGDRISQLAQLRNLAIQPLLDSASSNSPDKFTPADTSIIFLNDVAICAEDVLELVHQRAHLGADMVCAMDWTYVGRDPTFYDVWVARTINGDSFFEIPPDGNWNSAWNLFWDAAETQQRFYAHKPFQVFACWNGAVVFGATPVLEKGVRFRTNRKGKDGECPQGEPQLFCKDLWFHGHGRIAVVPTVNLEYSDEAGRKIKEAKGYTSRWVGAPEWKDEGIEWKKDPPEKVKCIPAYENQFFEAWNKSQPGTEG